jgi:hypothetical protein
LNNNKNFPNALSENLIFVWKWQVPKQYAENWVSYLVFLLFQYKKKLLISVNIISTS